MKILILGSTGMMGTAVKKVCIKESIQYLSPSHKELDITNKSKLDRYIIRNEPDIIINCAAIVGRIPCNKNKKLTYKVNVESVKYLSEICSREDILLIHVSSSSVFDEKHGPNNENNIPCPVSYYGRTKRLSELYVINNSCKYYIIRLPLLFGKRDNNSIGLTDKFLNLIKENKDISVATDKKESFGYTIDMANKILSIIKNELPYGIYHIKNEGFASFYEYVNTMNKYLGSPVIVSKAKCIDFDSNKSDLRLESIKIKPMRHWKEAMKEYLLE